MDLSEEEALAIVENLWKKSFEISKNTDDPLFSLYTKSFETIMVYMTQSLDYEYIQKDISSLDKDRQLALQSENSYDAHRCLSFGLIEAVQMMMKKNTKKLEEMIKQGYIPVPEIPKFPLEPKEEEIMDDHELIPAENEISSPSSREEIIVRRYDFSREFPADDQRSSLASIGNDFQLKEENVMDNDVNTGMDDFAPEMDISLNDSPFKNEIMDIPDGTFPEERELISKEKDSPSNEVLNENDEISPKKTLREERKSTRRVSRPVKYNSMEDSDEKEVEPMIKKTRLNSAEKSGNVSSQVKCVLCETYPKTAYGYTKHLKHMHKSTLNSNGIYLRCTCGFKMRSAHKAFYHRKKCEGLSFAINRCEDEVHSTPQCILCLKCPDTLQGYASHLQQAHKSTMITNGIYLVCSCGFKARNQRSGFIHSNECNALWFTLHKTEDEVHSTPQCILCEKHPKSAYGYAKHLGCTHKTILTVSGISLRCPCGFDIRSSKSAVKHARECEERQFSLHKIIEE